jgi:hypothetical protein
VPARVFYQSQAACQAAPASRGLRTSTVQGFIENMPIALFVGICPLRDDLCASWHDPRDKHCKRAANVRFSASGASLTSKRYLTA